PGNGGKIDAVAISPNGALVAAGGWDAARKDGIYVFDLKAGTLKTRIGDFDDVILHLTFSPDGRDLAATLGGNHGLHRIDTQTLKVIASDTKYGDDSYGAAFARDGRLFTVSYDGFLRAYSSGDFRLTTKVAAHGGPRPYSISVNPVNQQVAVGYRNTTTVEI